MVITSESVRIRRKASEPAQSKAAARPVGRPEWRTRAISSTRASQFSNLAGSTGSTVYRLNGRIAQRPLQLPAPPLRKSIFTASTSSKHHRLDCSTTPNHSTIKQLIGARGVSKHSVETMVGSCKLRMSFVHRASSLPAQQAKPAKRGTGLKSCKQAGSDVTVGHTSPRQLPARGVLISTRLHTPASRQPVREAVQHMHVAVDEVVIGRTSPSSH